MAYVTDQTISDSEYDSLKYPYNQTVFEKAVVVQGEKEKSIKPEENKDNRIQEADIKYLKKSRRSYCEDREGKQSVFRISHWSGNASCKNNVSRTRKTGRHACFGCRNFPFCRVDGFNFFTNKKDIGIIPLRGQKTWKKGE